MGIVGGMLAFRCSHFSNHVLYCSNATGTACNMQVIGEEQNSIGLAITPCAGHVFPNNYEKGPTNTPCTQTAKVIAVPDED